MSGFTPPVIGIIGVAGGLLAAVLVAIAGLSAHIRITARRGPRHHCLATRGGGTYYDPRFTAERALAVRTAEIIERRTGGARPVAIVEDEFDMLTGTRR
jgi:hypothetical protein